MSENMDRVETLAFELSELSQQEWVNEDEVTRNYWRRMAVEMAVPSALPVMPTARKWHSLDTNSWARSLFNVRPK
jgi:hypothetical protein